MHRFLPTVSVFFALTILLSDRAAAQSGPTCNLVQSVNGVRPTATNAVALGAVSVSSPLSSQFTVQVSGAGTADTLAVDNGAPVPAGAGTVSVPTPAHAHTLVLTHGACQAIYQIVEFNGWTAPPAVTTDPNSGLTSYVFSDTSTSNALHVTYASGGFPASASIAVTLGAATGLQLTAQATGSPNAPLTPSSYQITDSRGQMITLPATGSPLPLTTVSCNKLPAFSSGNQPVVGMGIMSVQVTSTTISCDDFGEYLSVSANLKLSNVVASPTIAVLLDRKALDGSEYAWKLASTGSTIKVTNDLSLVVTDAQISSGLWSLTGNVSLTRVGANATSVPVSVGATGLTLGPTTLTVGAVSLKATSIICPVATHAITCSATGTIVLSAANDQAAIGFTYANAGSITVSGSANVTLGDFTLALTGLNGGVSASSTSIKGQATINGPGLSAPLSIQNFSIKSTHGSAPAYSGTVTFPSSFTIGNFITLQHPTATFDNLESLKTTVSQANVNLNVTDLQLNAVVSNLSFTIPFTGGGIQYSIGSVTVKSGSFLGRRLSACDTTAPDAASTISSDQDSITICAMAQLQPGVYTGTKAVKASFTLTRNTTGERYTLTSASLSYNEPNQPIVLNLGTRPVDVNDIALEYVPPGTGPTSIPSDDPRNDSWFANIPGVQNCQPILQGSMSVSINAVIGGQNSSATAAIAFGYDRYVTNVDCVYGVSSGLVYVNLGTNDSAVIEKLAVARVLNPAPATTPTPTPAPTPTPVAGASPARAVTVASVQPAPASTPKTFTTLIAGEGRMQLGSATINFDQIGFKSDGVHTVALGKINFWKSAGYTTAQNIGSILTGLGAFIFGIFHH